MERPDDQIKVVILGDSGVGKSSIVSQYLSGDFDSGLESTVGVAFRTKEIVLPYQKMIFNI